jgi:hypothetical protein
MAVQKFIDYVTKYYNPITGFVTRLNELKEETEDTDLELGILHQTETDLEQTIDETTKLQSLGIKMGD